MKKGRLEWRDHGKAETEMMATMREKPRRPWYHLRLDRAVMKYEQTLERVPVPPSWCNARAVTPGAIEKPLK